MTDTLNPAMVEEAKKRFSAAVVTIREFADSDLANRPIASTTVTKQLGLVYVYGDDNAVSETKRLFDQGVAIRNWNPSDRTDAILADIRNSKQLVRDALPNGDGLSLDDVTTDVTKPAPKRSASKKTDTGKASLADDWTAARKRFEADPTLTEVVSDSGRVFGKSERSTDRCVRLELLN